MGVTEQEMEALSRASLLGALTCKEDLIFILQQIREKLRPASPPIAAAKEARKRTEDLRQAALSILQIRDAKIARRNNSVWGRIRSMFGKQVMTEDLAGY